MLCSIHQQCIRLQHTDNKHSSKLISLTPTSKLGQIPTSSILIISLSTMLLQCRPSLRIHGTIYTSKLSPSTSSTLHPHNVTLTKPVLKSRSYGAISIRATARVEEDSRAETKPQQSWHALPSGMRLEVQSLAPREGKKQGKAPLVFVHGSYHAAWCWSVHWLPYFASLGYDCHAVSLLGQGESDSPSEPGTIRSHASDVAHFVKERCSGSQRPPVLVGHSFGGLIVQYYLSQLSTTAENSDGYPELAGAVLACSVPPTGNSAVVKRFLTSKPIASIKVTLSLAAKMFATSVPLCRETFFSPSMPEEEVARYQKLMKESSKVPLFDLRKLNASLPVPAPVENHPPVLVLGAQNDFILDKQGIEETARFLGAKEVIVPGIAHDVMLDVGWRDAAGVLQTWLQTKL